MATKAHTVDIDHVFFDETFYRAYPNASKKEYSFAKSLVDDGVIAIETLLEVAVSQVGNLIRDSAHGKDFKNGDDVKKASVRTFNHGMSYAANVSQVHTKVGRLRVMCYERKQDKFYYFIIPNHAFQHISSTSNIDIPFELDGTPRRVPKRKKRYANWWDYEVESFEKMARKRKVK